MIDQSGVLLDRKISKVSKNFKIFKKFQNDKIFKKFQKFQSHGHMVVGFTTTYAFSAYHQ